MATGKNIGRDSQMRGLHMQPATVGARAILAVAVAGLMLGGCAGSALDTSMLGPTTAALKLPEAPSLPSIELPKAHERPVGTPTEVYERVGRGAVTCWFGKSGPLKGTHVYEATADSPHKGGQAEITIRERELPAPVAVVAGGKPSSAAPGPGKPLAATAETAGAAASATTPRSIRAFRVSIRPEGEERTVVETENIKIPDPLAQRMRGNVDAWAAGHEGCEAGVVAEAPPAPAATGPAPPASTSPAGAAAPTNADTGGARTAPAAKKSSADEKATRAEARVADSGARR